MKTNANISTNQMRSILTDLRACTGNNKLIEAGSLAQLAQENTKWRDFYHVETLCGKPTLIANNASALRKAVIEARGGEEPFITKIGLDSGRGRLTTTMTLQSKDLGRQKHGRRLLASGAEGRARFKIGGVKKVIVLTAARDAKETNQVMHQTFGKVKGIPKKGTWICSDWKVHAIATKGSRTHTNRHPCFGYHWKLRSADASDTLRTFRSNRDNHEAGLRMVVTEAN